MNHEQIADQIIFAVGGKENILTVSYCATKLRLALKNENEINREVLEVLNAVKGHFLNAGQLQIILDAEILKPITEALLETPKLKMEKQNLIQRALKFFTQIFQNAEQSASQIVESKEVRSLASEWVMPLSGEVLLLSAIPDEAFSSGAMGAGFAIQPVDNNVVSPVNGTIVSVFPTKHAIGIEADNGLEILLHIGIDTVKLNGEGFTAHVQDGQKVKAGDLLLTVDFNHITDKVPSIITPVIFTALTNGEQIEIINNQPVIKS